jgi:hypothetical protein
MRTINEIAADFDTLTAGDFDNGKGESAGWDKVDGLCDELRQLDDPDRYAPLLFRTMERLDEVELGTPRPLVHTLESWPGKYESLLAESVRRKPSPLTVWMVNRILTTHPSDADAWLGLLRAAIVHSSASASTVRLSKGPRKLPLCK